MPALNINDLNNGKKDLDYIAEIATSINDTAVDRLGRTKLTVTGAINSLKAFNLRGAFAGGTLYATKDVYVSGGIAYVALVDHVSTTVDADQAAGKVTVHQGATREELSVSTGSSLIGVEQGGTVQDRLDHAVINVMDAPYNATGDGVTDDTAAINAGIAYTAQRGLVLYMPVGRYKYTDAQNDTDNICIVGEKMPNINGDETALENGTIIVGTFKLRGKNVSLSKIGVDHGSAAFPDTAGNALAISARLAPSAGVNRNGTARLTEVVGLCRDPADAFHAVLVEGYYDAHIDRLVGCKGNFPIALKVQRLNIGTIHSKSSGLDGVIFKADTQFGDCDSVNAENIIVEGIAGATSNLIRVMSFDAQLERINIANLVGKNSTRGIYVDVNGSTGVAVNEMVVSNYAITGVETGFLISAGAGAIYSVRIGNGSATNVSGRVLDTSGTINSISVNGLYGSLTADSPNVQDAINIGPGVASFSIDNTDLVIAYSATNLAGITLNNGYTANWIGQGKFQISGVGIPRDGYSEPTIIGIAQTITPVWDGRNKESFVRALPDVGATVSTIAREMPNGTRFPRGYRLTIINDTVNDLIINNNSAGFILNRGAVAFTLKSNEAVAYVFGSAVWHMTT